jgi:hypothetical protein
MTQTPIYSFVASLAALYFVSHRIFIRPDATAHATYGTRWAIAEVSRGTRSAMHVLVSLASLGCSIYIILSYNFDPRDKYWAYSSIGAIIGFWLKG